MNQKIIINNPQSRVQGVGIQKGNKIETLIFKPGMNEVDKVDWEKACSNKIFKKKLELNYLFVVTDIETEKKKDGSEKIKINDSLIDQTFDILLLEKWLKDNETSTKQRNKIKSQIKKIKEQTEKEENKKQPDVIEIESSIRNYE